MLELMDQQMEQVDLPGGPFTFRRATLGDIPRLVALTNASAAADATGEGTTEEELRGDLTSVGYDLAQDGWVVEAPGDPGTLIAEGYSYHVVNTERAQLGVQVLPAWRRRGLGGELLRRVIARAIQQGVGVADADIISTQTAGDALLRRHGFAPIQTWVEMRFPAGVQVDEPAWAAGYQVRPYSAVRDPELLTTALNRGFIGHWENRERAVPEIEHRLAKPGVRPEGIFLAFGPHGDVAGVCWADISEGRNARKGEPVGYINSLAVVPEHRRRGVGRALLLTGMRWLRANGQGAIELHAIGDNEMALPLYYNVGYAVTRQGVGYRRNL